MEDPPVLRLAGQRARTAELHRAHGGHEFRAASADSRPAVGAANAPGKPAVAFRFSGGCGRRCFRSPGSDAAAIRYHSFDGDGEARHSHALEYTKGDRVMAAYLLGIGRTTLYRKLKEYRLDS